MQGYGGLQFYPYLDTFVERSKIGTFAPSTPGRVTMFANAWYGGANMQWPPSQALNPLLFSLHFAPDYRNKVTTEESLAYFKRYGAIGARDLNTFAFLQKQNITSFFSACATLLISPLPLAKTRTKIVVVDVEAKHYKAIVPAAFAKDVEVYEQDIKYNKNNRHLLYRYQYAYSLLNVFATAKLVITGRIHTALPCVALGIPVLFMDLPDDRLVGGGGGRSTGLKDLFHTVQFTKTLAPIPNPDFNWENPAPNPRNAQRDRHRATFWNIIRRQEPLRDMAKMMGVIPFKLSPDTLGDRKQRERFHIFHSGSFVSLLQRRTIESILFHFPGAEVRIHSASLKEDADVVLLFQEAGYDVHVAPYDMKALFDDFVAATAKLSSSVVAPDFVRQQGTPQTSFAAKFYQLLTLYIHGGSSLELGDQLVNASKDVENAIYRPSSPSPSAQQGLERAVFLRFKARNSLLDQILRHALESSVARGNDNTLRLSERQEECVQSRASSELCGGAHFGTGKMPLFVVERNANCPSDASVLRLPPNGASSSCNKLLNEICVFCNDVF